MSQAAYVGHHRVPVHVLDAFERGFGPQGLMLVRLVERTVRFSESDELEELSVVEQVVEGAKRTGNLSGPKADWRCPSASPSRTFVLLFSCLRHTRTLCLFFSSQAAVY